MFFYLLFFLIIKKIICQNETINISIPNSSLFNNDFNNMFFKEKFFILYLGTEMAYIKIDFNSSNSNISINGNNTQINYNYKKSYIQFKFIDEENFNLSNDNYSIYYLENKTFLFYNKDDINKSFIINFIDKKYNENNPDISSKIYNKTNITMYYIYYGDTNSITMFFSNVEYIFIKYNFLSFILIFFGCFSILYGAYHFMFGYIIHLTFLLYFAFFEFLGIFLDKINALASTLYLFFCFIFSISCSPLLATDKKDNSKYLFLKLIHGVSFGFSVFKILSYYFIFTGVGIENQEARRLIYFAFSTISVGIGLIFNLFNPFKKYIFLPCSAVSGSYYITKGLSYVVGGYFSNIITIKEKLTFDYLKNKNEIISTYLIINILLILFSIYYQIKHIDYKTEKEEYLICEEPLDNEDSRMSYVSNASGVNKRNEEAELIDRESLNKEKEEEGDEGNDDIEIDDQED